MTNTPQPAHLGWGLQSTDLAQAALTELYRTGDSVGMVVRSGRDGRIVITSADYVPAAGDPGAGILGTMRLGSSFLTGAGATFHVAGPGEIPIVTNSIVTANDDDRLLDHVTVSRVGGAGVVYSNFGLEGRWQTRSTKRTDLITQDPGGNADLARYAAIALAGGRRAYRVEAFKLDTGHGTKVWSLLRLLDVGAAVYITRRDSPTTAIRFAAAVVCGYTLAITRQNEHRIRITATVETDTGPNTTLEILP